MRSGSISTGKERRLEDSMADLDAPHPDLLACRHRECPSLSKVRSYFSFCVMWSCGKSRVDVHINTFTNSFLQNRQPYRELLRVFSHLQRRLTEKFSDPSSSSANANGTKAPEPDLAGLARYTGVSGFVFLRLICPAILGPKLFYIVRGE